MLKAYKSHSNTSSTREEATKGQSEVSNKTTKQTCTSKKSHHTRAADVLYGPSISETVL
jgi:hypothetical protein